MTVSNRLILLAAFFGHTLRNKPSLTGIETQFNSVIAGGAFMGRYLLLWMLGVPLPILVLIYAFGGLH
jgi:hypothetical protein